MVRYPWVSRFELIKIFCQCIVSLYLDYDTLCHAVTPVWLWNDKQQGKKIKKGTFWKSVCVLFSSKLIFKMPVYRGGLPSGHGKVLPISQSEFESCFSTNHFPKLLFWKMNAKVVVVGHCKDDILLYNVCRMFQKLYSQIRNWIVSISYLS